MGAECKKHGSAVTDHINQHISLLSETAIDQFRDRFQSFLFVRSLTDQFDLISALYTCPQHAQYTFCISCCVSIFKFDRTLKPQCLLAQKPCRSQMKTGWVFDRNFLLYHKYF